MKNQAAFLCNLSSRKDFQPRQRDLYPICGSDRGTLGHILKGTWLPRNRAEHKRLSQGGCMLTTSISISEALPVSSLERRFQRHDQRHREMRQNWLQNKTQPVLPFRPLMSKYCSNQNNETSYLTPLPLLEYNIQYMAVAEMPGIWGVSKISKKITNIKFRRAAALCGAGRAG